MYFLVSNSILQESKMLNCIKAAYLKPKKSIFICKTRSNPSKDYHYCHKSTYLNEKFAC